MFYVKKSSVWDLGAEINAVLAEVEYDHHNCMLMIIISLEKLLFCRGVSAPPVFRHVAPSCIYSISQN